MKIICPACSSDYTIADHLVGPEGRKVKCASCGHVWKAMPPAPEPALASMSVDDVAAAIAEAPGTLAGPDGTPKEDSATQAAAPEAAESAPSDPALAAWNETYESSMQEAGAAEQGTVASGPVDAGKIAGKLRIPGKVRLKSKRQGPSFLSRFITRFITPLLPAAKPVGVALGLIALVMAVPQRNAVVALVPDLAGLYEMVGLEVNVRGVSFSQFTAQRSTVAGLPVLSIAGTMTNVEAGPVTLGPLRLALLSEAGAELFVWQTMPAQEMLAPGENLAITSELTAPPESVASVGVRFLQEGETLPGSAL